MSKKLGEDKAFARLNLLNFLIILSALAGFMGFYEMKKAALLHELNFKHIKYNHLLADAVAQFSAGKENIQQINEHLYSVREQPQACLDAVGAFEEMMFEAIGVYRAYELCKIDLELADDTIEAFAKYVAGQMSRDGAIQALMTSSKQFRAYSNEFEGYVSQTADAIFFYVLLLIFIKGVSIIFAAYFLANGVKKDYKNLEQVQSSTDMSLAAAGIGTWSYYPNSGEMGSSAIMLELFGADENTMFKTYDEFLNKFVHPDDRKAVDKSVQKAFIDTARLDIEYRIIKANDQSVHHIGAKAKVFKNTFGQVANMTGACINIDHIKKQEQLVQEKNLELERSNQDLEQFAYIASHDLQEPLRTVSGYVDLLLSRIPEDAIGEREQKYKDFIFAGVNRMRDLIQDILAFSRVGRGREFEEVDLNNVIINIRDNLAVTFKENSAVLNCDSLPKIYGEERDLEQLFLNMITNSIKYKSDERLPVINVSLEDKTDFWQFKFADNGIGIKEEHFDKIFAIFQKLHKKTEYDGTGIGLAICKKIVEKYKGTISVESVFGEGTTFIIKLPKLMQTK